MKSAHIVRAVVTAAVLAPRIASAQSAEWIEVTRREPLAAGRTTDDVKRDALHAALAEAVRRVAGVHVSGSELSVRAESAGRIVDRYNEVVNVDATGRATDWTIVREHWTQARANAPGARISYELVLRVKVERDRGAPDASFQVRATLNAARFIVRAENVRDNDELVLRVSATRASFATIVIVAADSVFVLAPNDLVGDVAIAAGATLDVPSAVLREAGIRFRASLPPGVTRRSETLITVATLRPMPLTAGPGTDAARDTGVIGLAEFNRWLAGIPAGERAMAQTAFEVTRMP